MSKSRREFLTITSAAILGTAALTRLQAQSSSNLPPGAPSAFGAGPAFGPEVNATTFLEAEKLVQFSMNDAERAEAADSWRKTMAALHERRVGPRKLALESTLSPATEWNPMLPGVKAGPQRDQFVRSKAENDSLPAKDEDIAFATVTQLSHWIETRKLTFRAPDADLSGAAGAIQSAAAVRNHDHARSGASTSQAGRRRNCPRQVSRPAAWHSVGRERSSRYGGHSDNIWRGAIPQSRSER